MPIKNSNIYCINHETTKLVKNESLNALIAIDMTLSGSTIETQKGVPVNVYSCPLCGYIELYNAAFPKVEPVKVPLEQKGRNKTVSKLEEEVMKAFVRLSSPKIHEVLRGLELGSGGIRFEPDAILITDRIIYVVEVKGAYSLSILDKAAQRVIDFTFAYLQQFSKEERQGKPVIPLLVVPSIADAPNYINGVFVLKYDSKEGTFTNIHEIPSN